MSRATALREEMIQLDELSDNLNGKMRLIKDELADSYGPFKLFALFSRDDTDGLWDVIVSADWLKPGREGILRITKHLVSHLSEEQLVLIARVVTLAPDSDFVHYVNETVRRSGWDFIDDRFLPIGPSVLNGGMVSRGYILASEQKSRREVVLESFEEIAGS